MGRGYNARARDAVLQRQKEVAPGRLHGDLARIILDSSSDALVGMDIEGRITAWNKAAESIFGWGRTEVMGKLVSDVIIPLRYREAHERGFRHALLAETRGKLGEVQQLSALRRDGQEFPIELTRWSARFNGEIGFYGFIRDVTAREALKAREKTLIQQAHYDELTGLPNRRHILSRLAHALPGTNRRSGEASSNLAAIFIDLDHFKRINDSMGHAAGDETLRITASRLLRAVRPGDIVGRLSGDEFIVICPGVGTSEAAGVIAARILRAIDAPLTFGEDSVYLTASAGIAIATEADDAESLLSAADTSMYHAKKSGRAHHEVFSPQMREEIVSLVRMESELRAAVEREQLRAYFQPIVSSQTGETVALEALVRWQHPELGLLMPDRFIRIAEETGLIVPLGEWMLKEACRCATKWLLNRHDELPILVSVNLSGRQLAQADLVSRIEHVLRNASVDPSRVQFGIEVTESVLMRDKEEAAAILKQLKGLGVSLAIDDFGTGYSSLSYLKHLHVDTLKIDQSFVCDVATDEASSAIIRAVTALAHAMHLTVVAEGVETQAQADALRAADVDLLQGFLFCHPLPMADLFRLGFFREDGP